MSKLKLNAQIVLAPVLHLLKMLNCKGAVWEELPMKCDV